MADRKSTIYDLEAEKIKEKIIIFAADTGGYTQKEVSLEIQASLDELTELIDTAGAEVVGRLVQNRDRIANDLYLGRGKVEELRESLSRGSRDIQSLVRSQIAHTHQIIL